MAVDMSVKTYTPSATRILHWTGVDFGSRPTSFEPVHLVQYDQRMPIIAVNLYLNGEVYTLPAGARGTIRIKKKDGTFVSNNALGCNAERNVLYFEATYQMLYYDGTLRPVVEVGLADDDYAGSSAITVIVDRNPVQEGDIESSNEYKSAEQFMKEAEKARDAAAVSEKNAKTSETNAKTSETNAKNSADAAATSEKNAKTSETNAKTSETNAKTSETNAKNSANAAATSEKNAKASADSAAQSEANVTEMVKNGPYVLRTGDTLTGNLSYNMYGRNAVPMEVLKGNANGRILRIGDGDRVILGAGESSTALASDSAYGEMAEELVLASDNYIRFFTNCNTPANKKELVLHNSLYLYPGVDNTGSLGTSANRWASAYIADIIGSRHTTYLTSGTVNPSSLTNEGVWFFNGVTIDPSDPLPKGPGTTTGFFIVKTFSGASGNGRINIFMPSDGQVYLRSFNTSGGLARDWRRIAGELNANQKIIVGGNGSGSSNYYKIAQCYNINSANFDAYALMRITIPFGIRTVSGLLFVSVRTGNPVFSFQDAYLSWIPLYDGNYFNHSNIFFVYKATSSRIDAEVWINTDSSAIQAHVEMLAAGRQTEYLEGIALHNTIERQWVLNPSPVVDAPGSASLPAGYTARTATYVSSQNSTRWNNYAMSIMKKSDFDSAPMSFFQPTVVFLYD